MVDSVMCTEIKKKEASSIKLLVNDNCQLYELITLFPAAVHVKKITTFRSVENVP